MAFFNIVTGSVSISSESTKILDSRTAPVVDFLRPSTKDGKKLDTRDRVSQLCRRVSDSSLEQLSCSLLSVTSSPRRKFLSYAPASMRGKLLDSMTSLKRKFADSGVAYTPELCWAIYNAVDHKDSEAVRILDSYYSSKELPKEVSAWYKAFVVGSPAEMDLRSKLGKYDYVSDASGAASDFLAPGVKQEGDLRNVLSRAKDAISNLTPEAMGALQDVRDEACIFCSRKHISGSILLSRLLIFEVQK